MQINSQTLIDFFTLNFNTFLAYSPRLILAFFILFVGHYAISIFKRILKSKVRKRDFEPTLSKFLIDILIWVLRILLFVTFISKLGVETASFVAIIGAAGLAIGLSLQGSLSNFAGGILIILFKPFEVGDVIEAQGILGEVSEIQIFVTKLISSSNQTVFIPNGTLSNGTIINHSLEGTSRVEVLVSVSHDADLSLVKKIIFSSLLQNSKIYNEPKPSINVVLLNELSVKLAIHVWVNSEDFSHIGSQILEICKTNLHEAGVHFKN